jgi:hypothetical protein
MSAARFTLELSMPPVWERIDAVRDAVRSLIATYAGHDLCDALAMVSAELLENAVKYGAQNEPIELVVKDDDASVEICVTNAISPASTHPKALVERVAWVKRFDEPLAAYTTALENMYSLERATEENGLGIVRIFYEGGCDVECDVSTSGRVRVWARSRIRLTGSLP